VIVTPEGNGHGGGATPYGALRVVEVAVDPAGELTGMQFVDLGAEVLKIEPPGGVPSRHAGPFVDDVADVDGSLAYWYYNGGKRSIVIDVQQPAGRAALELLLDGADVLICSLPPRDLRAAGLDLAAMSASRPALIIVSITPFGLTGPWSEYLSSDLVGLAASGLLITSGYDDHSVPPIRPGGDQAFHVAASFAHIAALLALLERQRTGRGGLVDVSMHEAAGVTVELANPYWFYPRALVQRQTCRHAQPVPTQPAIFQCGDGRYVYFALILADQKPWQALVAWMAELDLSLDLGDAAFDDLAHRQTNFSHIQDVVECFFLLQDANTVYHEGQRRGLPIGILNAPEDLLDDEHLAARGFFVEVDQPGYGPVVHPSAPYRFSALSTVAPQPSARLGEHTAEYLAATRAETS
jgi:crotonobetainyl-CoA:carnitine CoA-transferase CaiB-like acyl-CoA transferase